MSLLDKLFSVFLKNVICCKLSVFSWCANHIYFQADFNIFKYFSKFLEKFGRQVSKEEFLQKWKSLCHTKWNCRSPEVTSKSLQKVLSVLNAQRIFLKTPWTFKDQIIFHDTPTRVTFTQLLYKTKNKASHKSNILSRMVQGV